MKQINMMCEANGCRSENTKDYYRIGKERIDGWEEEPIALCPMHAGDRTPILINPYLTLPDNSNISPN